MHGYDILCGISRGTFEIPHKTSYPDIERCRFYSQLKIYELLDLRAHKCFWNDPPPPPPPPPLDNDKNDNKVYNFQQTSNIYNEIMLYCAQFYPSGHAA